MPTIVERNAGADSACRLYTNKMVGTTAFNKRKVNFNKEKKLKARTKRKALKLAEKHKEQKVRLMTRSKKNQRKQEHRSRVAEKVQLLLGDQEMADAAGAVVVSSSSKGRKKARGKKQAKAASGSDVASAAAEVMQE